MINHCVQFDHPLSNAELVSSVNAPPKSRDQQATIQPSGSTPIDSSSSEAIEELLADISLGIEKLHSRHSDVVRELQAFSVRLAVRVVEKLVGSAESIQTQRLELLLSEAINRTEPALCIYLSSEDVPKLECWLANNSHPNLQVLPDDEVEAGECRVDFAAYELTSNVAKHVEEMEHRLLEVISDD